MNKTRSKIKAGEVEDFWIVKKVRQECSLSKLFNIMLANLEENMGRVRWRGVKLEGRRIYNLVYADDIGGEK